MVVKDSNSDLKHTGKATSLNRKRGCLWRYAP